MKTWITSDLHFGHANIQRFCPKTRGHFHDVVHMNSEMIRIWNENVQPGDTVYILGDVAFVPASEAVKILNNLNGDKILVEGNHDRRSLKDPVFRSCFKEIHKYLEITYNGTFIVMCHYPIYDHNGASRGSIMLHGHRHGNPHNIPGRIMDVGFDATGVIVTELDSIISKLEKIPHMYHHKKD